MSDAYTYHIKELPLGRSKIYELLAEGVLEAVKSGSRTLILGASWRRYIDNLPKVKINAQRRDA